MQRNNPNSESSSLFNCKEGSFITLGSVPFINVLNVGEPIFKATIAVNHLRDGEACIYNNTDNWESIETLNHIVLGVGDKLIIGDVQVMMTRLSTQYKSVRFSLRTSNPKTQKMIKGSIKERIQVSKGKL